MAKTTSWAFPNLIDVTKNSISIAKDDASIVNRDRLLLLTDPTELYNEPQFGVGLKRYLWQYNTANTKAIIQDRIKAQLNMYEPCVISEDTEFADGLLFTGDSSAPDSVTNYNELKMTVAVKTIYGDDLSVTLNNETGGNTL